jgi:hypothetical protein
MMRDPRTAKIIWKRVIFLISQADLKCDNWGRYDVPWEFGRDVGDVEV